MGTDKVIFAEELPEVIPCACLTGSDVSNVTGSALFESMVCACATGNCAISNLVDPFPLEVAWLFPRIFFPVLFLSIFFPVLFFPYFFLVLFSPLFFFQYYFPVFFFRTFLLVVVQNVGFLYDVRVLLP